MSPPGTRRKLAPYPLFKSSWNPFEIGRERERCMLENTMTFMIELNYAIERMNAYRCKILYKNLNTGSTSLFSARNSLIPDYRKALGSPIQSIGSDLKSYF
jgi:uncharacterized radical SAM superfamily Fe-S cluster-containing enzyme